MKKIYYIKNAKMQDIAYLSANNVLCYPDNVVDVSIMDYGKYVQVDRVISRRKINENTGMAKLQK
jgi:hypothetical protein